MDNNTVETVPKLKRVLQKLKKLFRSDGNIHEKRIQRRLKLVNLITRRLKDIKCVPVLALNGRS